jgi:RNA recognition motif-containing protein
MKQSPDRQIDSLFIKKIPSKVAYSDLKALFSQFGRVVEIKLKKYKHRKDNNIATVRLRPTSAHAHVLSMRPIFLAGKQLEVNEGLSKAELKKEVEESSKRMVYIENLFNGTTEEELKKIFERFGPVQKAKLTAKKNELEPDAPTFGFVTFKERSSADAALGMQTLRYVHKTGQVSKILIRKFVSKKMVKKKNENEASPLQSPQDRHKLGERYEDYRDSQQKLDTYNDKREMNQNYHYMRARGYPQAKQVVDRPGQVSCFNYNFWGLQQGRSYGFNSNHSPVEQFDYKESMSASIRRVSKLLNHSFDNIRLNRPSRPVTPFTPF